MKRGTERIRTGHPGVVLGLATVKSITHAHDGTLTPRAAGGLCVTVQLPAAHRQVTVDAGMEPVRTLDFAICPTSLHCARAATESSEPVPSWREGSESDRVARGLDRRLGLASRPTARR